MDCTSTYCVKNLDGFMLLSKCGYKTSAFSDGDVDEIACFHNCIPNWAEHIFFVLDCLIIQLTDGIKTLAMSWHLGIHPCFLMSYEFQVGYERIQISLRLRYSWKDTQILYQKSETIYIQNKYYVLVLWTSTMKACLCMQMCTCAVLQEQDGSAANLQYILAAVYEYIKKSNRSNLSPS